jgi:hypothetical protein
MPPNSYQTALVTYVDLLAFRNLIERSKKNPAVVVEIIETLERFHRKLVPPVERRDPQSSPGRLASRNFSDHIVRCKFLPDVTDIGRYANDEYVFLSEVQMQLAVRGILVRGGVCVGNLYVDEVIFGPALVKAYALESEYAIYPRIVCDRDLIHPKRKRDTEKYDNRFVSQAEDGAYFIDYLKAQCWLRLSVHTGNNMSALEIVQRHRQMIEATLGGRRPAIRGLPETVKKKYMWLALYHNRTIKWLREHFREVLESRLLEGEMIPELLLRF